MLPEIRRGLLRVPGEPHRNKCNTLSTARNVLRPQGTAERRLALRRCYLGGRRARSRVAAGAFQSFGETLRRRVEIRLRIGTSASGSSEATRQPIEVGSRAQPADAAWRAAAISSSTAARPRNARPACPYQ